MQRTRFYQHWWLLTLKGAIAVVFGLIALFAPGMTLITLARIFGILALVGGVLLLGGALGHLRTQNAWQGWVLEGLFDVVIGILLIIFPGATVSLFFILLAAWAIFMGLVYLVGAYRFRKVLPGWQLPVVGGGLSLLLGLVLAAKPFESAMVLTYLLGFVAVLIGGIMIYYSFRVKNLERHSEEGTFIYVD